MAGIVTSLHFLRGLSSTIVCFFLREWQRSRFTAAGVSVGRGVIIRKDRGCALSIGPESSIGLGTLLLVHSQDSQPSSLHIGRNTAINEYNNIRATGGEIRIGDFCQIAQFCTLIASNHTTETTRYMIQAPWESTKTSIHVENDVWIGASSVVLPGVTIGRGAVIGAGSVVTKDVRPYSIYAGVPARFIRHRSLHAEIPD